MEKVIVIGPGKIGSQLVLELYKNNYQVVVVGRKTGVYYVDDKHTLAKAGEFEEWTKFADDALAAFIAISSGTDGHAEYHYITRLHQSLKVPFVITCAKGALANYWNELLPILPNVGYSATVGCGVLLDGLRIFGNLPGVTEVHAVCNITSSLVLEAMVGGWTFEDGIARSIALGTVEKSPNGIVDFDRIIEREGDDIVMKAVILFNHLGMSKRPLELDGSLRLNLRKEHFAKYASCSPTVRFVVSIYKRRKVGEEVKREGFGDAGFYKEVDGCVICGRFADILTDKSLEGLSIRPIDSSAVISTEKERAVRTLRGPGAGIAPAVSAMMSDFESFTT